MGDATTTRLELQHRDLLKKTVTKACEKAGVSMAQAQVISSSLMDAFNGEKLWIIPATKDAARQYGAL